MVPRSQVSISNYAIDRNPKSHQIEYMLVWKAYSRNSTSFDYHGFKYTFTYDLLLIIDDLTKVIWFIIGDGFHQLELFLISSIRATLY